MSYILDALRKSQRERDPAPPVPPGAVHNITITLPARGGLIVVGGIVLLLALLGAAWFFWRSTVGSVPEPAVTTAPAASTTEPSSVAVAKAAPAEIAAVSLPAAGPVQASAPVRDLAEEAKVPLPVAPESKPARKPAKQPASMVQPVGPPPEPPMTTSTSDDSTPLLEQMPLEFQHALPPLAVTIHVYAPDPKQRILFINNREYHQGSQIAGDIRVEKIVPDGVVLSYQGERFKLSRPR